MGIAIEENTAEFVVRLEGAVDISSAGELHSLLSKAIEAGKPLSISLEQAQYLDVTAIQLIWSASQQARRSGVGFVLSGHSNQPLATLLADAGIPAFPVSAGAASANVQ